MKKKSLPSELFYEQKNQLFFKELNQALTKKIEEDDNLKQFFTSLLSTDISDKTVDKLINYAKQITPCASRELSGKVLNILAANNPSIIGGSADLVASTKATLIGSPYFSANDCLGRNIAYGVREHAMAAIK